MAREKAAARKLQQQLEREQRMAIEDEQFASDPFSYLSNLQQRHTSFNYRLEARKRKRLGQAPAAAGEDETGEGGIVGKRRRDEKHRCDLSALWHAVGSHIEQGPAGSFLPSIVLASQVLPDSNTLALVLEPAVISTAMTVLP